MKTHLRSPEIAASLLLLVGWGLGNSPAAAQTPQNPTGRPPERGVPLPEQGVPTPDRAGAARVPAGRSPARGAVVPQPGVDGSRVYDERDSELVFNWLAPFEPMLYPSQLESLRAVLRERMSELRALEDRRRQLTTEVLQTALADPGQGPAPREKAGALGQLTAEIALRHAELLQQIRPPLTAQQRGELRDAVAHFVAEGYEPFSFGPPVSAQPSGNPAGWPQYQPSGSRLPWSPVSPSLPLSPSAPMVRPSPPSPQVRPSPRSPGVPTAPQAPYSPTSPLSPPVPDNAPR